MRLDALVQAGLQNGNLLRLRLPSGPRTERDRQRLRPETGERARFVMDVDGRTEMDWRICARSCSICVRICATSAILASRSASKAAFSSLNLRTSVSTSAPWD